MQTIRGEMRREVDRQLDCWLDHVIKDNVLPLAAYPLAAIIGRCAVEGISPTRAALSAELRRFGSTQTDEELIKSTKRMTTHQVGLLIGLLEDRKYLAVELRPIWRPFLDA
jgi:hypothetical protein